MNVNMPNANNMDVEEEEIILPDRAPALWFGMGHGEPPPENIKRASVIANRINTVVGHPHRILISPENINFLNQELEIFQLLPQDQYYMVPPELVAAEQILDNVQGGKRYRRTRRGRSRRGRTRRGRSRRGRTRRSRHRK
jgi:hypothetical protein